MNPIRASRLHYLRVAMDTISLGLRLILILSLVIPQIPLGFVHAQEQIEITQDDWPSYRYDVSGTGYAKNEANLIPPLEQISTISFTSELIPNNPPVIAGGLLFVVEENGLCAYSLENASQLWCFDALNEINISGAEGSNIYLYGSDLVTGTIIVDTLAIATGEELGRLDLGRSPEKSYTCSPVNDGYIYCAIDDTITSADLSSSEIKWSKDIDGPGLVPVIVEDTLVVRTDQSIFSMNATNGEENWNLSLPAENVIEPMVFDGKVIVSGGEKEFIAFDLMSGEELWRYTPNFGDPYQAVYGDENLVVSTSQGVLEEIDPENGEIVWTYIPPSGELNACPGMAMANGHVYTSDITGALRAIELETGTEVWSTLLPEGSTPAGLAIANGTLAVLALPNQTFFFSSINSATPTPEIPTIVVEPTIEPTEIPQPATASPTIEIETETETPNTETPEETEVVTEEPIGTFEPTVEATDTPSPASQIDETLIAIEETIAPDEVPSLSSISPYFAMRGDPDPITLTLSGAGFSENSIVKWNDTDLSIVSISSTQITAEIPVGLLSVAGAYSITVYNPELDGGTSNALQFSVVAHFPDYEQQLATKTVTFDWDDIPGATKYRIQLSLDDFSTLVFDIKTTASNYAYLTKLIKRTNYFWHIKARINDVWTDWSQTMNFGSIDPPLAPTLLFPEFGLKTNDSTPTFSWSSVVNGDKYLIQVSKYSTFSPTILAEESNETIFADSSAMADGLYYWRVRAIDEIGDIDVKGAWSAVWSFKVDTKPPAAPVLYQPKDGVTKIGTPNYVWLLATGAKYYQWEYSETNTFDPIIHSSPLLATTSYTPPLQDPDTYYWRVWAFDKAGNKSSPSDYRSITIEPTVPVAPALLSPANGSTVVTNFPTFAWNAVDYGDTYRLQYDTEATFAEPYWDVTQSELSFSTGFLTNGLYYWRVKAINLKSEESSWSTVFSVTINAPLDTTPPTDPTGLTGTDHAVDAYSADPTITMSWNTDASDGDGVGVAGYSIAWNQVEGEMPDIIVDLSPDVTTVESELFADGTYYFHLLTCDLAGNCSEGLTVGPYKIDQNAPTNPTTLVSSSHIVTTPSKLNTVVVEWANDADDGTGAGLAGYSTLWDQSATTTPDAASDKFYFELTETSTALADGTWYFHFRTCDLSGLCSAALHLGPFIIDTQSPSNPGTVSSTSHVVGETNLIENAIVMTWSTDAADAGLAGLQGYSISWDAVTDTIPDEIVDIPSTTYTATSDILDNGTWYFHLRTCDIAGNCSAAVHAGPYVIDIPDTIAPTNPTSISSINHTIDVYSNDTTVEITWSGDADDTGGSGLAGYSTLWDQVADTLPDTTVDHGVAILSETSAALLDGLWFFHLRTCDNDGNCSDAVHSGPYKIDTMVPTNTSSVYSTSHTINVPSTNDRTINMTWLADATDGSGSGIAGVSIVWDTVSTIIPDNTIEIASPLTTTTSPELSNGLWYFHIRTCDAAGNCSDTQHSGPYIINVPTDPICGTISSNRVWGEELYTVTCSVTISAGVTVTVVPGAVIKFNSPTYLLTVNGTLDVQGTATKPAIFTSSKDDTAWGDTNLDGNATSPAAGDWAGIYVTDTGVVNLDYAEVRYGGYNSTYQANLYLINNARATIENSKISFSKYNGIRINTTTTGKATNLTVQNSTIENNHTRGVLINTSTTITNPVGVTSTVIQGNGSSAFETANVAGLTFNNNQLLNNKGYAAYLTLAGNAVPGLASVIGSGNTINGVGIAGPFAVTQTLTSLPDLVYVIPSSGWTINSGVTLTIPAGQVIKANSTSAFVRPNGVLIAQGTNLARVSFTSLKDDSLSGDSNGDGTTTLPAKGDWQGITVPAGGKAVLDYAAVMYAGNTGSAFDALVNVDNGGDLTLSNSLLGFSQLYGVKVNGIETQAILNNTITDCTSYGIVYVDDVDLTPMAPVIRGNTINNASYAIILGGNSDGITGERTITNNTGTGSTYNGIYILGNVVGTSAWSGDNGLYYYINNSVSVTVGASLVIDAGAVVKFSSGGGVSVSGLLEVNGTEQSPVVFTSVNDGEGRTPAAGDWSGIFVTDTGSVDIYYTNVQFGGATYQGSLYLINNARASIENSTISHSKYNGIAVVTDTIGKSSKLSVKNSVIHNNLDKGVIIGALSGITNIIDINSTTIRDNGSNGFQSNNVVGLIFHDNQISNNVGYGAVLDLTAGCFQTLSNISGSGNVINGILLSGTVGQSTTLVKNPDFPYIVARLSISANATLRLTEGSVIKIEQNEPGLSITGSVIAFGKAGEEVVFTSIKDDSIGGDTNNDGDLSQAAKGDWGTIFLNGGSVNFDYSIVRYAGASINYSYYGGAITQNVYSSFYAYRDDYDAFVTINHSVISENERSGIHLNNNSGSLEVYNSSFINNSGFGIYATDGFPAIIDNSLFDANGVGIQTSKTLVFTNSTINNSHGVAASIGIDSEIKLTMSGNKGDNNEQNTIRLGNQGKNDYVLFPQGNLAYLGDFSVPAGQTLTFMPGSIIKFPKMTSSSSIIVEGNLNCLGNSANPVVFTSLKDDKYGGDTNGDNSESIPSLGDWGSIIIKGGSLYLDHAVISYGGGSLWDGGVITQYETYYSNTYSAEIFITSSIISHNKKPGIALLNNGGITLDATVTNSSFFDNSIYGIRSGGIYPTIVNAKNNWWGNSSGPAPFGSGNGINYKTCTDPITNITYICQYYVDVIPWIGQTQYYGQNTPNQAKVSDPINTATGNYAGQYTDIHIPTRSQPLHFTRSYNSAYPEAGPLGYGWTFNYRIYLTLSSVDNTVTVTFGDGHTERYLFDGSSFTPPVGVYSQLEEIDGLFRLTTKDQTVYQFDTLYMLSSITDRNGNVTSLSYQGTSLSYVTAPDGRTLTFTYNLLGELERVSDPLGRSSTYVYDDAGNLISVTDLIGKTTSYVYDTNHRLQTITDANNHTFLTNVYDTDGRVIEQYDADNNKTSLDYDLLTHLTTVTDPLGHTNKYQYDAELRLTGETNGLSKTETYTYDASNNRLSVTNRNGQTTSFTYDTKGNVLSVTDALSGVTTITYDASNDPLSITDARENTSSFTYDAHGNRLTSTNPLGHAVTNTYYSDTDRLGKLHTTTDARGNLTTYNYNANGDLISVTDALGYISIYTYDVSGRKTSLTDARSNTWTYTYDNLNRLLTETNPLGGVTVNTYDAVGNQISKEDTNHLVTTYTYNNKDKLISITDPAGYITQYAYDAVNNKISETDGNNHITTYGYDAANRLIRITNPLVQSTTFGYDDLGNQTTVTNALGYTTTTTYDALNRPVLVTDPLTHSTSTTYDAVGNVLSITDANGHTTSYAYDVINRLTSVTDALDGIVTYGYDQNGNRVAMIDANTHTTTYEYDALNRLVKVTDPLGHFATSVYDGNGNRSSSTDANSHTTTYTYDDLNRLTNLAYDDRSNVTYTYDTADNRLTMADGTGTTTYAYDLLYRPTSITSSAGAITYTYDAKNRLSLTTPAGTTSYTYNSADQMVTVTDWDAQITSYVYDAAGRQVTITYPNGVVTTNAYDNANRLTGITTTKDTTTHLAITYTMDAVGNRLSMVDNDGTTTYTYDNLDRLSSVAYPFGTPAAVSYTYDPMGNRLTMTQDGVATTYIYNAADQLLSTTTGAITENYTWDNAGNMLSKGTQTFTWNRAGKLATFANGGTTASYLYNGDGVRVDKTVNSTTTSYLQDLAGGLPMVVRETTGSSTTGLLLGTDMIGLDNGSWAYYHNDGLGSTRALSNPLGSLSDRYGYDAFGAERSHSGSSTQSFTFTGEQVDTEAGFVFLRARYYDPISGRFISKDSFPGLEKKPHTLNRYTYSRNNPTNYIDPKGEFAILVAAGLGALGGGLGELVSQTIDNALNDRPLTGYNWQYVGSTMVGGAVGTVTTMFAGPVVGGTVSGGITQTLKNYGDNKDIMEGVGFASLTGAASGFLFQAIKPGFSASSLTSPGQTLDTLKFYQNFSVSNLARQGIAGNIGFTFDQYIRHQLIYALGNEFTDEAIKSIIKGGYRSYKELSNILNLGSSYSGFSAYSFRLMEGISGGGGSWGLPPSLSK